MLLWYVPAPARSAMSENRVAAIVLNYDGLELTLDTVESLLGMDAEALTIVVVDNGSTDGSHEAVGARFPEVVRIRTERNRWISGGLNLGIAWALDEDFDWLLLLNNDIEVDPSMLREMLRTAESDPTVGCVGPKCYYWADRNRLWSAGGILRYREAVTGERGMGEIDRGQFDGDETVDYINGCAMLVRRDAMLATGPWDPVYNLGVEDADWCARMKREGYSCRYSARAVLWHKVSPTVGGYTPGRTFQTGRSTALFVRRFGAPLEWLRFWFFVALAVPAAWLRELPKGNQGAATAKLRGVLDGWRTPLGAPPEFADVERIAPDGPIGPRDG